MTALRKTKNVAAFVIREGRHVNAKSNAGMGNHRMVFLTLVTSFLQRVPPLRIPEGRNLGAPPNEKACLL